MFIFHSKTKEVLIPNIWFEILKMLAFHGLVQLEHCSGLGNIYQ